MMSTLDLPVKLVSSSVLERFGYHWEPEVRLRAQATLGYIPWTLGRHAGEDSPTMCIVSCPLCGSISSLAWANDNKMWQFNGNFDFPTFSPSIHMEKGLGGCGFHVFVTNGRIVDAGTPPHGPKPGTPSLRI